MGLSLIQLACGIFTGSNISAGLNKTLVKPISHTVPYCKKMSRIHRVKGRNVLKTYRVIPYEEFSKILREDGEVFLEDSGDPPLRRQTVWRAARKLSEMVGARVLYSRALLQVEDGETFFEGYLFSIEGPESQGQKGNAS